jgi:hypothetical protein
MNTVSPGWCGRDAATIRRRYFPFADFVPAGLPESLFEEALPESLFEEELPESLFEEELPESLFEEELPESDLAELPFVGEPAVSEPSDFALFL